MEGAVAWLHAPDVAAFLAAPSAVSALLCIWSDSEDRLPLAPGAAWLSASAPDLGLRCCHPAGQTGCDITAVQHQL